VDRFNEKQWHLVSGCVPLSKLKGFVKILVNYHMFRFGFGFYKFQGCSYSSFLMWLRFFSFSDTVHCRST